MNNDVKEGKILLEQAQTAQWEYYNALLQIIERQEIKIISLEAKVKEEVESNRLTELRERRRQE